VQHLKTENALRAKFFLFLLATELTVIFDTPETRIFRQIRATSGKGREARDAFRGLRISVLEIGYGSESVKVEV